MGEIFKDPKNAAQAGTIEQTENILRFLIKAEGAARIVRLLQYAFEDLAHEIDTNQNKKDINAAGQLQSAAKFLKCCEILEEPYQVIRNEIRI